MKISILDPVDAQVEEASKEELKWLKGLLSYKAEFYRRKQFGGELKTYRATLVVKPKGKRPFFPVGFLPRIHIAAKRDNIVVDVSGILPRLEPSNKPVVDGKTLRPDQLRLINTAIKQQRGVLVAPTGSGKTVLLMGLLACFPRSKFLIVTHSTDIVSQTMEELRVHGFQGVCKPKNGMLLGRIGVATRQALVGQVCVFCSGEEFKRDKKNKSWICKKCGKNSKKRDTKVKSLYREWMRDLSIMIIDEVHLFGGQDSQYSTILRSTLAPIRIGLTGTAPKNEQIAMTLEGALSGIIGEVTHEEARDVDILAEVKLELLPVPYRSALRKHDTYRDILREGLIENRSRNKLIIEKAKELVERGLTVLIFINQLEHGDCLVEMAELLDFYAPFLEGATSGKMRAAAKKALMEGRLKCIISSKIWREGVNIPNLGAVILAQGGKAELSTLQSIGRGLRRVEGKKYAVIVDCLDPYPYLSSHTVQRLSIYQQMGWLK